MKIGKGTTLKLLNGACSDHFEIIDDPAGKLWSIQNTRTGRINHKTKSRLKKYYQVVEEDPD